MNDSDRAPGGAGEPHGPGGSRESDAPAPLSDAFVALIRRAVRRGRSEVARAADESRKRLEVRQMRRDLDHFWIRLGKTAHRLVDAGELDHPALRKAMVRIEELERELDAALGHAGASSDVARDAGEE